MKKGKCKDCKYWNDFANTYYNENREGIKYDCCSFKWALYHKKHNKGERIKDCFCEKETYVQLTLDFE